MKALVQDIGLTERLVESALSIDVPKFLNEETVRHALVDTLAVSVAARQEVGIDKLRSITLPGQLNATTPWVPADIAGELHAAFLNGTSAHFLDFDDVSPTMPLHPSAVLIPALLAAAGDEELPFDQFVEAFNVGQAMFRTIAQALPSALHYARGWHSTSTVGRLAAVIAVARLRGLDVETTATALAMASTMASGSRANFGTMTKPIHAGMAAEDALLALRWASAGITANTAELEASGGYFSRFGDGTVKSGTSFAEEVEERFQFWLSDWALDWAIKRYPSCYGTHRAVDAALDLRLDFGEVPDTRRIAAIDVTLHEHGTDPLQSQLPATGTEAKFSLEYCVALALIRGNVELKDFAENFEKTAGVRQLAQRVSVREEAAAMEFARVNLTLEDGNRSEATVFAAKGDSSNPLSTEEIRSKVLSCLDYAGLQENQAEKLLATLKGLSAKANVLEIVEELLGSDQNG